MDLASGRLTWECSFEQRTASVGFLTLMSYSKFSKEVNTLRGGTILGDHWCGLLPDLRDLARGDHSVTLGSGLFLSVTHDAFGEARE